MITTRHTRSRYCPSVFISRHVFIWHPFRSLHSGITSRNSDNTAGQITLFLYCVLYIPLVWPSSPAGFAVWLSRVQLWSQWLTTVHPWSVLLFVQGFHRDYYNVHMLSRHCASVFMKYPFQAFLLATATVGAVTITAGLGSPFFHGFIPSLVRVCSGGTVIVTMIIESTHSVYWEYSLSNANSPRTNERYLGHIPAMWFMSSVNRTWVPL
jgi:hypothetical protein